MFVIPRFAEDEPEESERLKSELLYSIAMMVGVIEQQSSRCARADRLPGTAIRFD